MSLIKKALAVFTCCTLCAAVFTGCGDDDSSKKSSKSSDEGPSSSSESAEGEYVNFTAPEKGEDVLVLTIKDYGDVKIKLFPDETPKGVENIKGLCEKNYYDGLIFHRIIKDFMIQGGDPMGTGMGGESVWGGQFDGGTSDKLTHVAGAVAYANSGSTATDGSQFYIVTGQKMDDNAIASMQAQGHSIDETKQKLYKEDGGAIWLDGGYTVFGQVYDGLDKVFEAQNVQTGENDKPVEDVVIESMRIEKYDGGAVKFHLSDYE